MERAEYHRQSRARMAETAKDASKHAALDAPERIDHRRRCTRHDHRTCCRGSRRSASLPCHTLRKRVEMATPDRAVILDSSGPMKREGSGLSIRISRAIKSC
jgi:hypothetical protein